MADLLALADLVADSDRDGDDGALDRGGEADGAVGTGCLRRLRRDSDARPKRGLNEKPELSADVRQFCVL